MQPTGCADVRKPRQTEEVGVRVGCNVPWQWTLYLSRV
jgi:hypothetical protein